MNSSFPFDVDQDFWNEVINQCVNETGLSPEEVERGLTYMLGRRATEMLGGCLKDENEQLMEELEIAILHSNEEK